MDENDKPIRGRFTKGDSRINRKGRPKDFEQLRKEAIKVANEILSATAPDGTKIEASRIYTILHDWANSKDIRKQELLIAYAFGKVPTDSMVSNKEGKAFQIQVIYANRNDTTDFTPPSAEGDSE